MRNPTLALVPTSALVEAYNEHRTTWKRIVKFRDRATAEARVIAVLGDLELAELAERFTPPVVAHEPAPSTEPVDEQPAPSEDEQPAPSIELTTEESKAQTEAERSLAINREGWFTAVAEQLMPLICEAAGRDTPPSIRIGCGFTSRGVKSRAIGECWGDGNSEDGHSEIFIRPNDADPISVAATVAHEVAHAVCGIHAKHGPAFESVIRAIGLEGKPTATYAGEAFAALVKPMIAKAGPYPHSSLNDMTNGKAQQIHPKLINLRCANEDCEAAQNHMLIKQDDDSLAMWRARCPCCGELLLTHAERKALGSRA